MENMNCLVGSGLAWELNAWDSMWILLVKEFQGKLLEMVWLVYTLIYEMSRQRKVSWTLIIVHTHIEHNDLCGESDSRS